MDWCKPPPQTQHAKDAGLLSSSTNSAAAQRFSFSGFCTSEVHPNLTPFSIAKNHSGSSIHSDGDKDGFNDGTEDGTELGAIVW
mmetsp:Transcript_9147/g.13715  ORF Transcript_9147/g.13715 Transcript_9147/m.13715 type:complete len:84 (-) Transcript_9147:343-594(-)